MVWPWCRPFGAKGAPNEGGKWAGGEVVVRVILTKESQASASGSLVDRRAPRKAVATVPTSAVFAENG